MYPLKVTHHRLMETETMAIPALMDLKVLLDLPVPLDPQALRVIEDLLV
jgi:hypothetical protein